MKTILVTLGIIVAVAIIVMGELLIAAWREIKRLRKELAQKKVFDFFDDGTAPSERLS